MRLHHVGVATEDVTALAEQYATLFDTSVSHEEEFDGLQVVFLDVGGSFFELLEPINGGTIARYLDDHGPGLHHVALETPDIEDALETAEELGIELVDETPRPGAWGHDVAFLHPGSTGGVLVEFVEG